MKNVLFATTALVAMSGTAFAAGHGGGVDFGGSAGFEYNSNDGFSSNLTLDLSSAVSIGDGLTAGFEISVSMDDLGGAVTTDNIALVYIESDNAKLSFGDIGSTAMDHVSSTSGMDWDVMAFDDLAENFDTNGGGGYYWGIRGDITLGSIDLSVSGSNDGTDQLGFLAIGASAELGSFTVGAGYQQLQGGFSDTLGLSIAGTFGSVTATVSYIAGGVDFDDTPDTFTQGDSIGVEVEMDISSAISASAYFATNTPGDNDYGVTAEYTGGSMTVGAYWDGDSAGGSNFGVDVEYALNDMISINAGYDQGAGIDVYGTYSFANDASFVLYYSETGEDNDAGYGAIFSIDF
jgi:hypothetical protein